MKKFLQNTLLVVLSIATVFLATLILDRVIGKFFPQSVHSSSLIFPSHSRMRLETSEFSHTISVNSMGLRDGEYGPKDPDIFRVLAVGDSFTYGMGVQIEQTWSKLLETGLGEDGYPIEVLNLGKPGSFPTEYSELLSRAIPLLKPDLVLLAILQGDDLAQSTKRSIPNPAEDNALRPMDDDLTREGRLWTAYPYFSALGERFRRSAEVRDLGKFREEIRDRFLESANEKTLSILESRDSEVLQAFYEGGLNPALVAMTIHTPDLFLKSVNLDAQESQRLIGNMAWEFGRIREIAERHGAEVQVVSVPYGVYVSARSYNTRQRLGFILTPSMLTDDFGDAPIRSAAEQAALPFDEVTGVFRSWCKTETLYFELDGHFNQAGHRRYADSLKPILLRYLD